jgi:hypothetical protein
MELLYRMYQRRASCLCPGKPEEVVMGTPDISIGTPPSGGLKVSGNGGGNASAAPAAAAGHDLRAQLGTARTWVLSTAERALFTFLASWFSALILGGQFNVTFLEATLFAAASAALAVVTAAIRSLSPPSGNGALDVVTRTGLTLVQAFTAAFVTSSAGGVHFTDWRAAALAGLAAAFTTLKGSLAVQLNGSKANGAQPATPASLLRLRPHT